MGASASMATTANCSVYLFLGHDGFTLLALFLKKGVVFHHEKKEALIVSLSLFPQMPVWILVL